MTTAQLLSWWNLIYAVPLFLALVYLGVYTISGITFGDPDADADMDADADGDIHADVDAHAEVDADTDVDAHAEFDADADADADIAADADVDADADADVEAHADAAHGAHTGHEADGGNSALALLGWLGIGRVPVSIVLMVLLLTWGTAGFITNQLLLPRVGSGSRLAAYSVPVAALVSLLITRVVAVLMARYLPMNETTARRRHELLGSVGVALFPISEQFGMASVREPSGDLYQVACRLDPSAEGLATSTPIPKGARVRLVGYNARAGVFTVRQHDPDPAQARV